MNEPVLRGRWALVTGASSGLGVDFARELASRGCNLVLVARREERLNAVRGELARKHDVEVRVLPMDLGTDAAPQQLYDRLTGDGITIDVLINNAGFGLFGEALALPWDSERAMLALDIIAVAHLTKLFAPGMVARNFGFILQVASIGAFQPSPLYASYSAAKSFVLNYGEALSYELRKTKVRCTVLSPGITKTEFLQVSGQEATFFQRRTMMASATVARIGIEGMLKGKPSVVPGLINTLTVLSNRLAPRRLSAALAHFVMR